MSSGRVCVRARVWSVVTSLVCRLEHIEANHRTTRMARDMAGSPTSSKNGPNGALIPEVDKLPSPRMTVDAAADCELKANYALLPSTVDGMLRDRRLILPMDENYQAQKQFHDQKVMQNATSADILDKVGFVSKLEEGFVTYGDPTRPRRAPPTPRVRGAAQLVVEAFRRVHRQGDLPALLGEPRRFDGQPAQEDGRLHY